MENVGEFEVSRILVPVDFSQHSEIALGQAVKLAQRSHAKLFLIHVIPSIKPGYGLERNWEVALRIDKELTLDSAKTLNDFARKHVPETIDVICDIAGGSPVEQIVESARAQQVDVVVMSTHGRTGLKHLLLGSVAEGVIRHAGCSVLVVRGAGPSFVEEKNKPTALRMIMAAIDFSPLSTTVVDAAERWARLVDGALVITHVVPIHYPIGEYGSLEVPALDVELLEIGQRQVRATVEKVRRKGFDVYEEVRQGNARVEIVEAAKKYEAEIIIIGTRGLTGLKHALLGGTAEYVVRHADRPVLVVRERSSGNEGQLKQSKSGQRNIRRSSMELFKVITDTHPFLQNLPREEVDIILKGAVIAEFGPGEIIFREGDYANKLFLIHEGAVHVECHTPERDVIVETLHPGELLGWSWLFPPFSWHFQARAAEKTITLQLDGAHLLIESEKNDKLGHQVMKRIAQILIHRLQATRKRLVEQCEKAALELGETL